MNEVRPAGLRLSWLLAAVAILVVAVLAGITLGAVGLPPGSVAIELLNLIPGVHLDSGLNEREIAIVTDLRLPRVVLGMLVGSMLALAGASYQGVFRNPLADPYLLGVAAGAGLGATLAIALRGSMWTSVPIFAFVGALLAVSLTYLLGIVGGRDRSGSTLILAGVAISAFLAAIQTFVLQRYADSIREVYSWLLGRLATGGWHDVLVIIPYAVISALVVLTLRRELDVLSVGDAEAAGLGLHPGRSRLILVAAASLATAAAVAVSGLIGFVGIVVPHIVRLLTGSSYRAILPLSMIYGGAFMVGADLIARTVAAPTELPIGVVTAFIGAPFFILVLRTTRSARL
ncbi:MAG: iron ABC transporter permease [Hamadaea sp.]|uniref:FecCD family ABC transporter permease n=1 Tax=Hamadaea sp. TaxID=2024425 RepID=UPI0017DBFCA2|nr:iron ABC transporter permease [Hamadaea sp.]NUR72041.1 iron ABC transporter permease [Hamadaea sp.]NUT17591.1 iron ABC transporter permease [Hamadaea sp.]